MSGLQKLLVGKDGRVDFDVKDDSRLAQLLTTKGLTVRKYLCYYGQNWHMYLDKLKILCYNVDISNREQRKRKCQMESEKDDTPQTKQSVIGMLCIGQRDSQKDLVLSKEYPLQMPIIYIESKGMSNKKHAKNFKETTNRA